MMRGEKLSATLASPQAAMSARQAGFSYLFVLFFVALTAAALAALGQSWSLAAQRERERELEFRGGEIARAILSYSKVSATPGEQYPLSLQDLLEDRRGAKTRHHLRRLYADPFTGKPDWALVADTANPRAFNAVHSRSETPLLRQSQPDGSSVRLAQDWIFAAATAQSRADAELAAEKASPAASAASAPLP
ncbi:MAG: type II secretion system protein [Roseateles sp.]